MVHRWSCWKLRTLGSSETLGMSRACLGLGLGCTVVWDLDMGGRPNVETDIKCCEVSMNKVLRISSLKDHE